MSELLKTIVSLSCSGSLLIIIFFLFRGVLHKRLSKQWQYYIWLVVIARLLLPFTLEANMMELLFQKVDKRILQAESFLHSNQYMYSSSEEEITADVAYFYKNVSIEKRNLVKEYLMSISDDILFFCWIVIAVILFIRKITVYQCFVNYIKAGCVEVSDIDLLEKLGKLIEQKRVKTSVEIYTNSLISSPLLIGFFRPSIVLPTDGLPKSEFYYTILHELMHYKRRDMFYKWLVQAAICVHWFNPLVYLMGREVEQACELSCDEAIISQLGVQEN